MSTNTKVKITGYFGDEHWFEEFEFEASASASRKDIENEICNLVRDSYEDRCWVYADASKDKSVSVTYDRDGRSVDLNVDVSDIHGQDDQEPVAVQRDFERDGCTYRKTGEVITWYGDTCYKWIKTDPSTSPVDVNGCRTTGGYSFEKFVVDSAGMDDIVRAFDPDREKYVVTDFDQVMH